MIDSLAAREKWATSAEGWIRLMRRGDLNRELLLDAPMLTLAGDVRGRRVLDVGCGEGRFCRMLADRGATTVGIDPTAALVAEGREIDGRAAFARALGEALPFADAAFDLVVAYLVLIDVPDFRRAIREFARVLKPGGRVIVANLNSFVTTQEPAWFKDAEGKRLHVKIDNYFDERPNRLSWAGIEILNWHRPMQAYMKAFLEAGLNLESYDEPRPSEDVLAEHPAFVENDRVPLFHTMSWRK